MFYEILMGLPFTGTNTAHLKHYHNRIYLKAAIAMQYLQKQDNVIMSLFLLPYYPFIRATPTEYVRHKPCDLRTHRNATYCLPCTVIEHPLFLSPI